MRLVSVRTYQLKQTKRDPQWTGSMILEAANRRAYIGWSEHLRYSKTHNQAWSILGLNSSTEVGLNEKKKKKKRRVNCSDVVLNAKSITPVFLYRPTCSKSIRITSWRLPHKKSAIKRQAPNKSVTSWRRQKSVKLCLLCRVMSFHKFHYNDLFSCCLQFRQLTVKACLKRWNVERKQPEMVEEIRRFVVNEDVATSYTYLLAKVTNVFPGLNDKPITLYWRGLFC